MFDRRIVVGLALGFLLNASPGLMAQNLDKGNDPLSRQHREMKREELTGESQRGGIEIPLPDEIPPIGVSSTGTTKTEKEKAVEPGVALPKILKADVKIGIDVQEGNIVGPSEEFPSEVEVVVGWSRVTGASEPTEIVHVWKHEGKVLDRIPLQIAAFTFRTFSRKTIYGLIGNWTLEVMDTNGDVIGSQSFRILPPKDGDTRAGSRIRKGKSPKRPG